LSQISLFVRHDAELDAFGYFQCIHLRDPDAARRFLEAIDETIEGLALQPGKGRLRSFRIRGLENVRSWRVNGFENYLIFYRLAGGRLEILRIKHGTMRFPQAFRRDPQ
jgi:toxin ParE1/3/4